MNSSNSVKNQELDRCPAISPHRRQLGPHLTSLWAPAAESAEVAVLNCEVRNIAANSERHQVPGESSCAHKKPAKRNLYGSLQSVNSFVSEITFKCMPEACLGMTRKGLLANSGWINLRLSENVWDDSVEVWSPFG
jgi:hypothetical protein